MSVDAHIKDSMLDYVMGIKGKPLAFPFFSMRDTEESIRRVKLTYFLPQQIIDLGTRPGEKYAVG